MVTSRNNFALAIRSAAPEAAIAGMRAAGTLALRALWRSRKAIRREAVSCKSTLAIFETAGVRARRLAMPPFARPIASARESRALSTSSGGSVEGAKGLGRVDPVFMGRIDVVHPKRLDNMSYRGLTVHGAASGR